MPDFFARRLQRSTLGQTIGRFIFRPRTAESGEVILVQRRVFILPTRSGLGFAVVLLLLLLGSINYQLSLGFALTFLLAASAVVGILHTFRNLAHLQIQPGKAEPVFAGDWARFQLCLTNPQRHDRYAISLHTRAHASEDPVHVEHVEHVDVVDVVDIVDVTALNRVSLELSQLTRHRGWLVLPRVTLTTVFPLGLWRAWAYWYPSLRCLVYPAPETTFHPLPTEQAGVGESFIAVVGQEDFSGIRPFVVGDPLRQLAWKAIARQADDTLLTKQFESSGQHSVWLDWSQLPTTLNTEQRLARLTRWVLEAEQRPVQYGLRLPHQVIAPDHGTAHRAHCLRALALFGD